MTEGPTDEKVEMKTWMGDVSFSLAFLYALLIFCGAIAVGDWQKAHVGRALFNCFCAGFWWACAEAIKAQEKP